MLDTFFSGLFEASTVSITLSQFLLSIGCALVAGLILAGCYMVRARYSRSFVATLALMPALVAVVILMVNGNVGAGVAVMGAFSLVRFRSAPGSAREISAIFLAMGTGLVVGMGYLGYALLCAVVLGLVSTLYNCLASGSKNQNSKYKTLRITIPEDLDYTDVFDPILAQYTTSYEMTHVKTSNMGSLFRLTYDLTLADTAKEKELIDKLRCRNGNLEITVSKQETGKAEL